VIGDGGLQRARFLGGAEELDAERARGVEEVLRPVSPGGKEEQESVDD